MFFFPPHLPEPYCIYHKELINYSNDLSAHILLIFSHFSRIDMSFTCFYTLCFTTSENIVPARLSCGGDVSIMTDPTCLKLLKYVITLRPPAWFL